MVSENENFQLLEEQKPWEPYVINPKLKLKSHRHTHWIVRTKKWEKQPDFLIHRKTLQYIRTTSDTVHEIELPHVRKEEEKERKEEDKQDK